MSPFLQESIGFAGFATNVLGNVLIGYKSNHAWWVRITSNALWLLYAWQSMTVAVAANAIVFSGINVWCWIKWYRSVMAEEERR